MTEDKRRGLLSLYKDDKEMQKLILEVEQLTNQKQSHVWTHYIVPTALATAALLTATVHLAKLIFTD